MLSFYLAFIYVNKFSFYRDRILCMADFLFEVQEKNRLKQKGLLKRFSISCYGKQETLEDIRSEKAMMFNTLKKGTPEYDKWFFKYTPGMTKTTKPSVATKQTTMKINKSTNTKTTKITKNKTKTKTTKITKNKTKTTKNKTRNTANNYITNDLLHIIQP
jgi:hypothetical protein